MKIDPIVLAIIAIGLSCFIIGFQVCNILYVHGFTTEEKLNIDCDRMVYSENWTLGYLRNITAYCSNGEN